MNRNLVGGLVAIVFSLNVSQSQALENLVNFEPLVYGVKDTTGEVSTSSATVSLGVDTEDTTYVISGEIKKIDIPDINLTFGVFLDENLNLKSVNIGGDSLVFGTYKRTINPKKDGEFEYRKIEYNRKFSLDLFGFAGRVWEEDKGAYRRVDIKSYTTKWGSEDLEKDMIGNPLLIHMYTIPYFIPSIMPSLEEGESKEKNVLMTFRGALYKLGLTYSRKDGKSYVTTRRFKVGSELVEKGEDSPKVEIRNKRLMGVEVAGFKVDLIE